MSDRPAGDLVDGLGLAGLVVEPGAAADQGTADAGTRPEGARGPPIADGEPVHGGADDGGAAVVGQVVVGGGGGEGADDGDAGRRAEQLGDDRVEQPNAARADGRRAGRAPPLTEQCVGEPNRTGVGQVPLEGGGEQYRLDDSVCRVRSLARRVREPCAIPPG